jgi:hypothetical protein
MDMPEKATMESARQDLRQGKAPSTAAGEFVREEIEQVRRGSMALGLLSSRLPSV